MTLYPFFPPDPDDANYAWKVNWDHLDGVADDTYGPHNAPLALLDELNKTGNDARRFQFRMYDDDGELYYSGRIVFADPDVTPDTADEEAAFGPLNDYGLPNAGAVRLDYLLPPYDRPDSYPAWRTL